MSFAEYSLRGIYPQLMIVDFQRRKSTIITCNMEQAQNPRESKQKTKGVELRF